MENNTTEQTSHSVQLVLTEEDVDGAKLQEPLEKHHKNSLTWWLVCYGQPEPPKNATKATLISRWVNQILIFLYASQNMLFTLQERTSTCL